MGWRCLQSICPCLLLHPSIIMCTSSFLPLAMPHCCRHCYLPLPDTTTIFLIPLLCNAWLLCWRCCWRRRPASIICCCVISRSGHLSFSSWLKIIGLQPPANLAKATQSYDCIFLDSQERMTWSNDPKENNTLVRTYSLFEIEYCLSLYRAQNALDVEYGTNSTYLHAHMPKINSSYVKICESSQKVLAQFSPTSCPKFSIVTRAIVLLFANS